MGRLYVTRHGQSKTNADKLLVLDHGDNELTELGKAHAASFGEDLASRGAIVTRVATSPLLRAQQTTLLILNSLDQTMRPHITLDVDLRELDWARHEGDEELTSTRNSSIDQVPLVMPAKRLRSTESQRDVYERVTRRVAVIVNAHADASDVLIVTHHFPVKAIRAWIEHHDPERMNDYSPENLCVLSYELDQVREVCAQEQPA